MLLNGSSLYGSFTVFVYIILRLYTVCSYSLIKIVFLQTKLTELNFSTHMEIFLNIIMFLGWCFFVSNWFFVMISWLLINKNIFIWFIHFTYRGKISSSAMCFSLWQQFTFKNVWNPVFIQMDGYKNLRNFEMLWSCVNRFATDERLEDAIVIQISPCRFWNIHLWMNSVHT